jgi:hypothetical protein
MLRTLATRRDWKKGFCGELDGTRLRVPKFQNWGGASRKGRYLIQLYRTPLMHVRRDICINHLENENRVIDESKVGNRSRGLSTTENKKKKNPKTGMLRMGLKDRTFANEEEEEEKTVYYLGAGPRMKSVAAEWMILSRVACFFSNAPRFLAILSSACSMCALVGRFGNTLVRSNTSC